MKSYLYNFLKPTVLFLAIFFSLFFFNTSHAFASTLYFNGAIDNDWNTLGNWWTDVGDTVPAVSLPGVSDDVIVQVNVTSNSGADPSINSMTVHVYNHTDINITVATNATFYGSIGSNYGNITGDVIFNSGSDNNGTVTGNAFFGALSGNGSGINYGTITGDAIFDELLNINNGTVGGSATYTFATGGVLNLSGGASWSGTAATYLGGDLVPITLWNFSGNGSSNNFGPIPGDATFSGGTVNNGGSVAGDATFNDTSFNNGTVSGNATFNNESHNNNTVSLDASFNDLSYNGFGGVVTGDAIYAFANAGVANIPDLGQWGSGTSGADLGSDLAPITSWIFNGSSFNGGTLADATFNDTSYNNGTISGNATFNFAHLGVITISSVGQWGTGTAGANIGDDAVPITSWVFIEDSHNNGTIPNGSFSDASHNFGTVTGNATFNDSSGNIGVVSLDATFNNTSFNQITVSGNATFNNGSRNSGTVGLDATFNDISYNDATVIGNAIYNYAHGGTITIADGGNWGTGTSSANIGDDAVPIDFWIFNGNSTSFGNINGDAIFNGTSVNSSNVSGVVTFNDASANCGAITGVATFNYAHAGVITIADGGRWGFGTSGGDVGDDALAFDTWIFNGNSWNQSTVAGNATFNDTSYNQGTVTVDATFFDSSYNNNTVNGDARFNDISVNYFQVDGNAIYNFATGGVITIADGGHWGGGTANANIGIDFAPITTWVFDGNSTNEGIVAGNASFHNTSVNNNEVDGDACFALTATDNGFVTGNVTVCTSGTVIQHHSGSSGALISEFLATITPVTPPPALTTPPTNPPPVLPPTHRPPETIPPETIPPATMLPTPEPITPPVVAPYTPPSTSAPSESKSFSQTIEEILHITKEQEQTINKVVAFVVAPVAVILNTAPVLVALFASAGSFADFYLVLLKLWNGLLTYFGLKKKHKYWGTVYDSQSKQPLDPVVVDLINADTNQVITSCISDLAGRYGFLVQPGRFKLMARKTHYEFPSKKSAGAEDEIFDSLYHGEIFEIKTVADVIAPNIPMDPLAFDWNQQAKQSLIKFHPVREIILHKTSAVIFWAGFLFSIYTLNANPSSYNFSIIIFYLLLYVLSRIISAMRLWGRLLNAKDKTPISGKILELHFPQMANVISGRALSAPDGKFFLKSNEGEYNMNIIEMANGQKNIITSKSVKVGKEGLVNADVEM